MAPTSSSDSNGCLSPQLEEIGQHISMPSVESSPSGPSASVSGETGRNHHHPLLAVGIVVSDSASNGNLSPSSSPSSSGATPSRKRKASTRQEPSLGSLGVESKRAHLIHKGLSEEATAFISDNLSVTRTRQRYEPAQQEFQQWLKDGSYEQGVNPAIVV
ncbi:hypothetical protein BGX30_008727, partial [Mortierella sp. GBA39]